ncbi:alpha/beta hydrolase family protein [Exiguobacterium flavidum]|uniref:alpha/beta hydrolase family protein n=1 Tax=Exiguobacterium flavidum TaxID=2184695 RepID=UPI000DF7A912|nr:prolyl oligopeptidase family serine peptidase [Exiguobacterium flavidum]
MYSPNADWFELPPQGPHRTFRVWYHTSDGERVGAYVVFPHEPNGQGLLYLRGGTRGIGMVRRARLMAFAHAGFLVMAPFYRGNFGGSGKEDFGDQDLLDATGAYDWLAERTERVSVFGFSRGGQMALLLAHHRDVARTVSWAGVTNLAWTYEEQRTMRKMLRKYTGGTPDEVPDAYAVRSPIGYEPNGEVLLLQGREDRNVTARHAIAYHDAYPERTKIILYPFAHQFPFFEKQAVTRLALEWLENGKIASP